MEYFLSLMALSFSLLMTMAPGGIRPFFIDLQPRPFLLSKTWYCFTSWALKPQETNAIGKLSGNLLKARLGFNTPGISMDLYLAFMTYRGVPSPALHPVLNAFFGTSPLLATIHFSFSFRFRLSDESISKRYVNYFSQYVFRRISSKRT